MCTGYTPTDLHARLGLPKGEEGVPGWLWLDAPAESLRDVDRGTAVSVSSRRYQANWTVAQLAPSGFVAKLAERRR